MPGAAEKNCSEIFCETHRKAPALVFYFQYSLKFTKKVSVRVRSVNLLKSRTLSQLFSYENIWGTAILMKINYLMLDIHIPANTYLFKVNNINTKKGVKYVQS